MDLKHKHWAVAIVGALIIIFALLTGWYTFHARVAKAPVAEVASSTPAAPTNAPETLHLTEHATYYDIDLTYPSGTPLASQSAALDAAAVASMKAFAESTAAQFKQDGNFANLSHDDIQIMGLDQRKEALSSEYKTYTSAHTVSYVFMVYEDTLGAHPNAFYKTFTFDTQTGKELALGDLFLPSVPYLEQLSTRARAELPDIIATKGNSLGDPDYIHAGTEPTATNFQNFYLEGQNLILLFAPYQVGPWALGTVLEPIPLSAIKDSLRPAYL